MSPAVASIAAGVPVITTQPASQTVANDSTVAFTVTANSASTLAYQWYRNGTAIAGATRASYTISAVQASSAGTYTAVVTNATGSVTSLGALLKILPSARLTNLAVRTALASNQRLIVGFTVDGDSESVLVRAAGPALTQFGLTGVVADPKLELYHDSTKIAENSKWPSALTSTFVALGAFPLTSGSNDAALLQNVSGNYSAQVAGTVAGVVLAEIYEANPDPRGRLVNLSARNHVGAGENVLIAGFHIGGTGTLQVLIRAVASSLALFGVPNVLVAPRLELYNSAGLKLAESESWDPALASTFSSVGAFALPAGSKDAALLTTLTAGKNYTVQVSGAGGNTGEALVEIYEVP